MDEAVVDNPGAAAAYLEASREDRRRKLPEPPPVWIASVRDMSAPMLAGLERQMDAFYGDLLRFERIPAEGSDSGPIYRAENHDLRFRVIELPDRQGGARPIGIVTPHFGEVVERLSADKIEHEYVRGVVAGTDGILLQDPSGNWVALAPRREIP